MARTLGEKLYEGIFPMRVEHNNDDYGHLHHDAYHVYVDVATDRFLGELGLSHEIFIAEMGFCLIVHGGRYKHPRELKRFEKFDVSLEVNSKGTDLLSFVYRFIKKEGEKEVIAFWHNMTWVFLDAETRKSIPVPEFFLEALRKAKD